jgi:hypothetical protein
MFLLTRESRGSGYINCLGVFDTLDDAKSFERACLKCHMPGHYIYEIRPIAHNLRA